MKTLKLLILCTVLMCVAASGQVSPKLIVQPKSSPNTVLKLPVQVQKLARVFNFSLTGKKLIVLMHGITGPTFDSGLPTTGYFDKDIKVNTIQHVKAYFTYGFLLKLLGNNGSIPENPELERQKNNYPQIETLSGKIIKNPRDFYTIANTPDNREVADLGDYVYKLSSRNDIYVVLLPRNGVLPMMVQAQDAVKRLYNIYEYTSEKIASQPQIYFVCHSGGGIVTRMIMKPGIRFDNLSLDETQASFIRDRTVCVTTISTPHEGSPLPAKIIAIKKDAAKADAAKNLLLGFTPIANLEVNPFRNSFIDIIKAVPGFEDRDSRDNMSNLDYVPSFNSAEGDPQFAKRSDSSLIPVYCFGGRRPTGPYYNDISQDAFGGVPQYYLRRTTQGSTTTIELLDKAKIMYIYGVPAAHYVLHAIDAPSNDPMNWGCNLFGAADKLDRIKWGGKTSNGSFVPYSCSNSATNVKPILYCLAGNDGEVDTDGFVDYASAVGFRMGKGINEYFDHKQGGSYYRFYDGPFENHNHGTISQDQMVAQFVADNIIKIAGPYPNRTGVASLWTK